MIYVRKRSGTSLLDVICAMVIVLLMVQMLIPAVHAARDAAEHRSGIRRRRSADDRADVARPEPCPMFGRRSPPSFFSIAG